MKSRIVFMLVGLFTIAPSVFGSIPAERRDLAAFIGGKSECEAKIKSMEQSSESLAPNKTIVKAEGRQTK